MGLPIVYLVPGGRRFFKHVPGDESLLVFPIRRSTRTGESSIFVGLPQANPSDMSIPREDDV